MSSRVFTLFLLGALSIFTLNACGDKTELQNPQITQINPLEAAAGENITISGTNFGDNLNQTTVKFGQTIAVKPATSSTGITVQVPPNLPVGDQSITIEVGQPPRVSNTVLFTIKAGTTTTTTQPPAELPKPTITSISPDSATPGTRALISGTNFGESSQMQLRLAGQLVSIDSATSDQIVFRVPAIAPDSYLVQVSIAGRLSNLKSFTVNAVTPADSTRPTITAVTPTGSDVNKSINRVSVTFSEAMNTSTANGAISFTIPTTGAPSISGQVWSSDSRTLSVSTGALAAGTTYKFKVASTVKDLAGNTLPVAAEHEFSTANDVVTGGSGACTPTSFSGPNLIKNPDFSSTIPAGQIGQPLGTPVPTSSLASPTAFGDFAAQMRYNGPNVFPNQPGAVNSFSIFNKAFNDADYGQSFDGNQPTFPGDSTYSVAATPYWMYSDGNVLGQKQVDAWLVSQGRSPGIPAEAYRPYPPPLGKNDPLPLPLPFNVPANRIYTIWEQEVSGLEAGADYEFTYYVSNVIGKFVNGGSVEVSAHADPEISVIANGSEVTPPTKVLKQVTKDANNKFGWERRCVGVKADASGKVKLQLRNSAPGNDGDDLALTQLSLKH